MAYQALPIAVPAGSWARYDGVDFASHRNASVSVVAMARSVGCPVGNTYPAPAVGACTLHPPNCLLGASVRLQLGGPEQANGRTLATFDIPGNITFGVVTGRPGDALTPRTGFAPVFMVFDALPASCGSSKAGGVVDWFRFVPSAE